MPTYRCRYSLSDGSHQTTIVDANNEVEAFLRGITKLDLPTTKDKVIYITLDFCEVIDNED